MSQYSAKYGQIQIPAHSKNYSLATAASFLNFIQSSFPKYHNLNIISVSEYVHNI